MSFFCRLLMVKSYNKDTNGAYNSYSSILTLSKLGSRRPWNIVRIFPQKNNPLWENEEQEHIINLSSCSESGKGLCVKQCEMKDL